MLYAFQINLRCDAEDDTYFDIDLEAQRTATMFEKEKVVAIRVVVMLIINVLCFSITPTSVGGLRIAFITSDFSWGTVLKKWMMAGKMQQSEIILFMAGYHDLTQYIIVSNYDHEIKGDMLSYLEAINEYHGYYGEENYPLNIEYLRRRIWIKLLNPINLFVAYFYSVKYIGKGEESIKVPFVKILGCQYLPSINLNINPFGSELVLTNFFRNDRHLISGEIRIGDNKLASSYGGGLSYSQIWSGRPFQFDSNLDVWKQGELELGGEKRNMSAPGWGGAVRFGANFRLLGGEKPVYGHVQLGYKTGGYLHGQFLKEGLIWRFGLAINVF